MGRPKLKVELGERFGFWEVIDNNSIIIDKHSYVKIKCTNCNYETIKPISDLKRRNSLSCQHCKGVNKRIPINIGDRYNEWTVLSNPIKGIRKNSIVYLCKCSCGEEHYVSSYELRSGKSSRCHKCGLKIGKEKLLNQRRIGDLTATKFLKLQKNAQARNISFNISMSYLWNLYCSQNKICAITGDLLSDINKASLDRIDSKIGYEIGNVQWVTKQANLSKHIMSMQELLEFCNKVINHANQQPSQSLTTLKGSETNS